MRLFLAMLALAGTLSLTSAHARWKPEFASAPQEVQDWYQHAQLTEAARKRFPFMNCCDHADVVKTKFRVNKTTAGDEWFWLDGLKPDGTENWRRVPDDVVHVGEHAPNGQPTLFVYDGKETCFYPGDGGI